MTNIEWTDAMWNPVTGVRCHEDRLTDPLRWKKPRKVFVNSMADLFHADVPDWFIDRVFAVMSMSPQHTFQVLTKRPDRMRRYMTQKVVGHSQGFTFGNRIALVACDILKDLPERLANTVARCMDTRMPWPLPNVWLGVSVEDQAAADERVPHLLATPAAVRFLSCEPLLGPIDLEQVPFRGHPKNHRDGSVLYIGDEGGSDFAWSPRGMLHWVIVGGESGPGARPCSVEWIRDIVHQCKAAAVPVFVKQLGSKAGLRSSKGGDPSEWPEDLRVREFPGGGK